MRLLAMNRIAIDKPSDLVWRVTVDVEDWPDWTPTVTTAVRLDQGDFRLGSEVRLKQPVQAETVWRVTAFDNGRSFAWETEVNGVPMVAGHQIVGTPHGCESIMTVHASGFAAFVLWPLLKVIVGRAIALENRSLKARCETLADRPSAARPHDRQQEGVEPVHLANT